MDRYLIEWAEDYGTADLRLALIAGLATAEMVRAEMAIEAAAARIRYGVRGGRRNVTSTPKRPVTNMAAGARPARVLTGFGRASTTDRGR